MSAGTNYNELLARRLQQVTYQVTDHNKTNDKTWKMLVDLSNGSGFWKHKAPGTTGGPPTAAGIVLYGARGVARPANTADIYAINFAIVTRADATNADLTIFSPNSVGLMDVAFPFPIDLSVVSGKLRNAYGTRTLNTTTVQTDVNLLGPDGENVLPAAGDLIFQIISNGNVAGAPTGNIVYAEATAFYTVDKLR